MQRGSSDSILTGEETESVEEGKKGGKETNGGEDPDVA